MDLDRIARRQHGLVTRRQLDELGFTRRQVGRRISTGVLVPYRRGVYRVGGAPLTQDQAWLAAVLGAGGEPVLSHGSAAAAWALRGFEQPTWIDLLDDERRLHLRGVAGHHTRFLPPRDRTRVRRIPVTTVARTFVDGCGLVSPRQLGRSVDDALRRRLVTLDELVRCTASVPLSGRRKSRPIRAVLGERVPGYDPGGSAEELDVLRVLRRAGIPLPVQQYRVRVEGRDYVLDYAWPDTMHCLEYQGEAWHATVSALHDDSDRTRRLQRGGWTVWPLTATTSEVELVVVGRTAATPNPVACVEKSTAGVALLDRSERDGGNERDPSRGMPDTIRTGSDVQGGIACVSEC